MSRICENCGVLIHGTFIYTEPIVRHDPATGFAFRFCSQECANHWVEKLKQPLAPALRAIQQPAGAPSEFKVEELKQAEQRWLNDGGADRLLNAYTSMPRSSDYSWEIHS